MWMLIVISTIFGHQSDPNGHVYSFQEFESKSRCLEIKQWIDQREAEEVSGLGYKKAKVETQCVKRD